MAKNIQVNDRNVRVQIWDTAGQESYRSITRSYYKSSTCAFIVYDITNKKSFTNVTSWLNECREMCFKDILICLVGNKTDLESKRVVSKEEGKKFAQSINALFILTSCQESIGINELFYNCGVKYLERNKIIEVKPKDNIVLGKDNNENETGNANGKKKKRRC